MSDDGHEERLRALEDERDILRLMYAYGHTLDYGLEAEFVDCWTETARLDYEFGLARDRGETVAADLRFEGRAQIAGFFRDHSHASDKFHKHLLVEPVIVPEGDRARVDSYFARLDTGTAGPRISAYGRYRDVVVRCQDGRWRFAERRGEIESVGRPGIPAAPSADDAAEGVVDADLDGGFP